MEKGPYKVTQALSPHWACGRILGTEENSKTQPGRGCKDGCFFLGTGWAQAPGRKTKLISLQDEKMTLETVKSPRQGPSKEGDGGCMMRCLGAEAGKIPSHSQTPEMTRVHVAFVSETNTKRQNNRGNAPARQKLSEFSQGFLKYRKSFVETASLE